MLLSDKISTFDTGVGVAHEIRDAHDDLHHEYDMLSQRFIKDLLDEMVTSAIADVEEGLIVDFEGAANALDVVESTPHESPLYSADQLRKWIRERLEGVLDDAFITDLEQDVFSRTERMIVELLKHKA